MSSSAAVALLMPSAICTMAPAPSATPSVPSAALAVLTERSISFIAPWTTFFASPMSFDRRATSARTSTTNVPARMLAAPQDAPQGATIAPLEGTLGLDRDPLQRAEGRGARGLVVDTGIGENSELQVGAHEGLLQDA